MKSPCQLTYKDLIKEVERELSTRERVYPGWQILGRISGDVARHRIEVMRRLLKMLKQSEPVAPVQADLFAAFQQTKTR